MKLINYLLGGWSGVIFLFLYLPMIPLVVYSFNASRSGVKWNGFTLQWYQSLLNDHALRNAMLNSLLIASVATVISTALGTLGAWMLYRYTFPFTRTIGTLVFLPMVVPEVIMGLSLRIFFSYMNQQADDYVNWFALGKLSIIIAHTTFCFPFVMVAVQARLAGLDPSLEEAAQDLGATPSQAFLKVIVPYLMPAIVSGALMAFTLSMDEYIVTKFTTGPQSETFPIKVFGLVKTGYVASANAISTVLIVLTVGLVVLSETLRRRSA
jgi:spermidine/putrescine transport system permease protein